MTTPTGLSKVAVDATAEAYWADFFSENGYGKLWTRKLPRRVAEALQSSRKEASAPGSKPVAYTLAPLVMASYEEGVTVEGVARVAGAPDRLFVADFDHDGNLLGCSSTPVAPKARA